MELTTTVKKVKLAAKRCQEARITLMDLFPEAFDECRAVKSTFKFGDMVTIHDGSNNVDKNTDESRCGILFRNHKAVVIETNLNLFTYRGNVSGGTKKWMFSDLLIRFETGEEVYTSSLLCNSVDNF